MQPLENTINVPAFLSKLWRMVNDPSTDHLISWSTPGKSFVIQNRAQFWYELLPVYYKHNNMSSFVRQLNMYGFHKLSPVDNGSVDTEKDEIQFYHPSFQKNHPELLTNIKRKVTAAKITTSPTQNVVKSDDLSKVLTDIKLLRGRQQSVDSQLSSMKRENAVLWRELAILRQKHLKQQQIVNKLIQFLVTIVQPGGTRMGGLGVKRHYPLMLNESPEKKKKLISQLTNTCIAEGPTIHELDNTDHLSEELEELEESANAGVDDLLSDTEIGSESLDQFATSEEVGDMKNIDSQEDDLYTNSEKIFLNPNAQDTLLTNLINGSYNSDVLTGNKQPKKEGDKENQTTCESPDLTVARLSSIDDLHNHMETTQSELEQLKEILNGCNSFDANALLGLFNEDAPDYVNVLSAYNDGENKSDPMVSGSALATYDATTIDFSQLFDETSDPQEIMEESNQELAESTVNTPQITNNVVPVFPGNDSKKSSSE